MAVSSWSSQMSVNLSLVRPSCSLCRINVLYSTDIDETGCSFRTEHYLLNKQCLHELTDIVITKSLLSKLDAFETEK